MGRVGTHSKERKWEQMSEFLPITEIAKRKENKKLL
jgi:hypothetical protein